MANPSSTDLIFQPTRQVLATQYGADAHSEVVNRLVACHEKLRNDTQAVLHLTTNFQSIADSGYLAMSAGGLAGCVYGTPVYADGSMHNLGVFLAGHELPMFLQNKGVTAAIDGLVIQPADIRYGCVDYLAFGHVYWDAYLKTHMLRHRIKPLEVRTASDRERGVATHLQQKLLTASGPDAVTGAIDAAVQVSRIIQMLFFEIILEYVFLYQNDSIATQALAQSEMYNAHPKKLIFALNPAMAVKFSIANFTCSLAVINAYLTERATSVGIFTDYQPAVMYDYVATRLQYYLERYVIDDPDNLAGHVLFRYFDQRKYLETVLAQTVWRDAAARGVTVLTYVLPKGEIGVLPGAAKVYRATLATSKITHQEKLNLHLVRRMHVGKTQMRDPYETIAEIAV